MTAKQSSEKATAFIFFARLILCISKINIVVVNLCRFAKILLKERRLRELKSPHTKKVPSHFAHEV